MWSDDHEVFPDFLHRVNENFVERGVVSEMAFPKLKSPRQLLHWEAREARRERNEAAETSSTTFPIGHMFTFVPGGVFHESLSFDLVIE